MDQSVVRFPGKGVLAKHLSSLLGDSFVCLYPMRTRDAYFPPWPRAITETPTAPETMEDLVNSEIVIGSSQFFVDTTTSKKLSLLKEAILPKVIATQTDPVRKTVYSRLHGKLHWFAVNYDVTVKVNLTVQVTSNKTAPLGQDCTQKLIVSQVRIVATKHG